MGCIMDEKRVPIPETVGEMIEFLKKFPKDWKLDVYVKDDNAYEYSAYHMDVVGLDSYGALQITVD